MMKKIAVICALPPERNTGMATVDLSAHSNIGKIAGGDAIITLYTYGKASKWSFQEGELPFNHVDILDNPDEFLASDAFIFWGDFIHSRAYWAIDRGAWDKNAKSEDLKTMRDNSAKYMFLSGLSDEDLKKVIIFGSTIITNNANDSLDEFYQKHSSRLFNNAGAVLFRDALSAAKVSPLRRNEASLSCDCAFLLEDEHLKSLKNFKKSDERNGIGVFFGRTPNKVKMIKFAKSVSKELELEYKWLPWFETRRKERLLAKFLGVDIKGGYTSPGHILSELSGFKYIITDTYHVCVNAWRMGIPTICIGLGAGFSETSLSDKKKEILFEMYGANPFYVYAENLNNGDGFRRSVKNSASTLLNDQLSQSVRNNIRQHVEMAVNRLSNAMETILKN